MYVTINQKGEIKEVGVSSDTSLTSVYIADDTSPFIGWSEAKICCYKITVNDGIVTMLTPYVDSRMIEHFDQVGMAGEENSVAISISESTLGTVMEDVLPEQAHLINQVTETVDTLMTSIIPSMMGEEI